MLRFGQLPRHSERPEGFESVPSRSSRRCQSEFISARETSRAFTPGHEGALLRKPSNQYGSTGRRLEETPERLETIAEKVGFSGEEQTRLALVRVLGLPPSEYRKHFASTEITRRTRI